MLIRCRDVSLSKMIFSKKDWFANRGFRAPYFMNRAFFKAELREDGSFTIPVIEIDSLGIEDSVDILFSSKLETNFIYVENVNVDDRVCNVSSLGVDEDEFDGEVRQFIVVRSDSDIDLSNGIPEIGENFLLNNSVFKARVDKKYSYQHFKLPESELDSISYEPGDSVNVVLVDGEREDLFNRSVFRTTVEYLEDMAITIPKKRSRVKDYSNGQLMQVICIPVK